MNGIRIALSGVGLVATAALFTATAAGQGGDTIGTATVIGALPYSDAGTTVGYVDDYDEVCPFTGSTSPDVVYAYTPGVNETVDITLCDYSQYDTKLYVYENAATPGTPFACNDDACVSGAGQSYVSELLGLNFVGGNTYYIVVDGYYGASGDYTIDMTAIGGGCPEATMNVVIFTDNYPGETTWEIVEHGVGVIASGGPYADPATLYEHEVCVNYDSCFDFTIYDAFGDGICCAYGNGYYEVYYEGTLVGTGGEFGSSESILDIGPNCVPATGACCVGEDCVATNTLDECDLLGGVWYEGEDCATFMCPEIEDCSPDSIYGQIPTAPDGGWTAGTSDANVQGSSYVRYEEYSVGEEIGGVWFWGLTLFYPWAACTEDPMDFEIVFWPDDGTGMPDLANPACTYNLSLAANTTTYVYSGFDVLRWETDLDPCCDLQSGWMSVQGTSLLTPTDCWFLWASSGETGAGQSWFYPGALPLESNDFDLSMCLMPCEVVEVDAYLDIKPGSCPNPFNCKSKGVLPTALLGTMDFDVTLVDPASLMIARADGMGGSVAPIRFNYEDVATPFLGELCDCHVMEGDGFMDMTIKFKTQELVSGLMLEGMTGELELVLSGMLMDGTPFTANDCILFVPLNEEDPGDSDGG